MTIVAPNTLTARMRSKIAVEHEAIEQTPFSMALMRGTLTREEYVQNLSQMAIIHTELESLAMNSAALEPYFSVSMCRADVAIRDVQVLGFNMDTFPRMEVTERTLGNLQRAAKECPRALIGVIYVLEGSRMGSLVLAKPLAASLKVSGGPQSGIDYHIEGAPQAMRQLKSWKERVDHTDFSTTESLAIENAAVQFMRDLLSVYRATPVHAMATTRDVA